MGLRHVGDAARDLGARHAGERPAIDPHRAALRRQQAEQGLEQRGLAGAVGAEQADDLAAADREVDVAADRLARVAEAESLCLEPHAQPWRPRASSHRNAGAPTNAVRMPIGVSTAAIVRASVSTSNR